MSRPVVDRAVPQIQEPMNTPEQKVKTGNQTVANVNASANIADAPEVETAAGAWATAIAALDANNKAKAKARLDLALAETAEGALLRRWAVRRNALLVAIEAFADGSAQLVQSFNVPVEVRQPSAVATTPVNLRMMKGRTPTVASVRWDPTEGALGGYLLQHASNPDDPTTYSAPISTSQARYHLKGQTPGTTVYFRVLACNGKLPNGQTPYTAWVGVIVT